MARRTALVVAREGLRLQYRDETGAIVRHRFITSKGLHHELGGEPDGRPVRVSVDLTIERYLAAGDLIEVPVPAEAVPAHARARKGE